MHQEQAGDELGEALKQVAVRPHETSGNAANVTGTPAEQKSGAKKEPIQPQEKYGFAPVGQ